MTVSRSAFWGWRKLRDTNYLDINLLVNCVLMPSIIDARTVFIEGIKK